MSGHPWHCSVIICRGEVPSQNVSPTFPLPPLHEHVGRRHHKWQPRGGQRGLRHRLPGEVCTWWLEAAGQEVLSVELIVEGSVAASREVWLPLRPDADCPDRPRQRPPVGPVHTSLHWVVFSV